ncbi:uncharacterized protein LOC143276705 [Babylonia areolata]|uniref:uncharacterized protein LOC143276705 n=1 Tax=Babylonia areolata TaxID=304850 RepID=UPI003FD39477
MQRLTQIVLVACLMMVMTSYLQQTMAAPSWRPQGRFGKRGSNTFLAVENRPYYWRPQGRYGKRSGDSNAAGVFESTDLATPAPLMGEVQVPVEMLATDKKGMLLRVAIKPCTITGAEDYPSCNGL